MLGLGFSFRAPGFEIFWFWVIAKTRSQQPFSVARQTLQPETVITNSQNPRLCQDPYYDSSSPNMASN